MRDEMPENKSANDSNWWSTLPGVLTGLAAIITAVTGLIVAFNHFSGRSEPTPPSSTSSSPSPASSGSFASSGASAAPIAGSPRSSLSGAIALPELHQVKHGGGDTVITILSADFEPIDADRRLLKFRIRYLNNGKYPANFWRDSYRLIIDDAPRAPTNSLNEVVAAGEAKEGDVVFQLPVSAKDVVLQITSGEEQSHIAFNLP
jgi:hypothetical protein